jgi:hypothetical protein
MELGQMERRFGSEDAAWVALVRSLQLDPSLRVSSLELRELAADSGRPLPAAAERVLAATASCPARASDTAGS